MRRRDLPEAFFAVFALLALIGCGGYQSAAAPSVSTSLPQPPPAATDRAAAGGACPPRTSSVLIHESRLLALNGLPASDYSACGPAEMSWTFTRR